MNDASLKELNLARALKAIGNYDGAIDACRRALLINPNSFELVQELGIMLWEQGQVDEALAFSAELIRLDPRHPDGYVLRGHASIEINNLDDSLGAYEQAIKLNPYNAELHNSLALALKEYARFKDAFESYNHALSLAPHNPEIHFNRAILSLLTGDYASGFDEYEWRKQKRERYGHRDFSQPEWRGEDLAGKTLLVHHEQGLGDAIQFSRYVKLLKDLGVSVLYAAHQPLVRLLSSMSDIEFVDANDPSLRFDYHCPLLSLPLQLGTTVETIPAPVPYLAAEAERVEKWQKRIGDSGFKVGIAWQGSGGRFAKNRLFPLEYLKPLQNVPGVRLIGLHKAPLHTPWALPENIHIENLGPGFDADTNAFLDTAAVIECCDLVLSCDTAVAHLAGAMGKPTWVILRHVPHWVWMMDRLDSPWYPAHRLFRQKKPGDWESAFVEVYEELPKLVASKN